MDVLREVRAAEERIRPHILETTLQHSPLLSERGGAQVYCKLENLQHTGSFKVRGALNKVLSLSEEQRGRGVVTASTGNHGAAVAYSLGRLGATGIVYVPQGADPSKVEAIKRLGAEVRVHGQDCAEAEVHARAYGDEHGLAYISPYNDPQVVGGQGTIGVELARQLEDIDAVFVALGGGGLISGIAAYLKSVQPGVSVIGCSPENSQVMIQSVKAGHILDLPSLPTLSDGTAGGIEPGAITFELCRSLVDDYVTVSEEEIAATLLWFIGSHHMLIEGAAAVPIAAYLKNRSQYAGQRVVIVLCGANIGLETVRQLLNATARI